MKYKMFFERRLEPSRKHAYYDIMMTPYTPLLNSITGVVYRGIHLFLLKT